MKYKYALIQSDEDGNPLRFLTGDELQELLDEPEEYAGITRFITVEEFESLKAYDPNYWKRESALLIKFEILEPKPTVVKFRL